MKICRFDRDRFEIVEGDEIIDVTDALDALPPRRWPFPMHDDLIANWDRIAPAIAAILPSAWRRPLANARLESPVANPSKIIGIAGNRKGRDSEKLDFGAGVKLNNARREADPPRFFLKGNSSLCGPTDGVRLRFLDRRTDPEAELTAIIGKAGTNIPRAEALGHVFGYCIGIDMSLRGAEPPSARKSIDTYSMLGPWIVTANEVPDPDDLDFLLSVNGEIRQSSNTSKMQFGVAEIVAFLSTFFTLRPGDVIMAGSPLGFDPVRPGDRLIADFQYIGAMAFDIHAFGD